MAEQSKRGPQAAKSPQTTDRPAGTAPMSSPPETSGRSTTPETSGMPRSTSRTGNGGLQGETQGLVDQMRSSATDVLQTAKTNTATKIEEQKATLSSGLSNVADNVRKLGDNLKTTRGQEGDPLSRFAADYSETAAQKLESVATYFDSHDLNAIYHDVENLARRNPAVFIGGAMALGFLAARFFKSSTPRYMEESGARQAMQTKTTRSLSESRAQTSM